jgi:hypothetical protein
MHDDAAVADEIGNAFFEIAEGVVEVAHDMQRNAIEGKHD